MTEKNITKYFVYSLPVSSNHALLVQVDEVALDHLWILLFSPKHVLVLRIVLSQLCVLFKTVTKGL